MSLAADSQGRTNLHQSDLTTCLSQTKVVARTEITFTASLPRTVAMSMLVLWAVTLAAPPVYSPAIITNIELVDVTGAAMDAPGFHDKIAFEDADAERQRKSPLFTS